ncbi:MAG TPA: NYN domain-containing protein [Elusimicrobia bacterium]|nr:NYN domain-containing protein [Elusimicrobiota bacterium]
MALEPSDKRAVAFIDGQNLYHAVRAAFGCAHPNYDAKALAEAVCRSKGWRLVQTRFYTGIPAPTENPFWHHYWTGKLGVMVRQGVHAFSRSLQYLRRRIRLPDGSEYSFMDGEEKGIDVRIAIDVIRAAHRSECDVVLLFSQDQDLSEVADEIRAISREQGRWLKIASAYPLSRTSRNCRGINKTDWVPIEREMYDACLDRRDYRA